MISEQMKAEFLELVKAGFNRQEATHQINKDFGSTFTARNWRALCSPQAISYDKEFAGAYEEAMEGKEHSQARLERLRAAAHERAMRDSDRLLEKLLIVYDPDWAVFRSQRLEIEGNLEVFANYLKGLSPETLARVREELESKRAPLELLPAANE